MAVHRILALLFLIIVPQLVVEGCWPSKIEKRPLSRCEQERADAQAGRGKTFVKQCAPDGTYSTVQCAWKGDFCFCAHPYTGVLFPETRLRGRPFGCDDYYILREDERTPCEKQRDSDNPTVLPGGFIKECEADGSFKLEQCTAEGECYCVNSETGELFGRAGGHGTVTCEEVEAMHLAGENWSQRG
ncbi:PREDICTED: thyroglobulin-like [Branchiostoma belcheri]|uniref:Thyroglobulin-like n=1 Tax=Branchiostoma belcheri TaxID=7741 RepID=A0A6P5AMD7_BRABE|nr:PREDICTED: thyroglobulin-like [Branchiostoma belcheri]